jgi:hypothetical protein
MDDLPVHTGPACTATAVLPAAVEADPGTWTTFAVAAGGAGDTNTQCDLANATCQLVP